MESTGLQIRELAHSKTGINAECCKQHMSQWCSNAMKCQSYRACSHNPPMASYFYLSIIFLLLQILRHTPHQCNLPWSSCNHHQLYPIPITLSAWHHIIDLPYDLWTTLFYFPFLVPFLYPAHPVMGWLITSHCTTQSGPYHLFHHTQTLCLFLLIICTYNYPKKEGSFSPRIQT